MRVDKLQLVCQQNLFISLGKQAFVVVEEMAGVQIPGKTGVSLSPIQALRLGLK